MSQSVNRLKELLFEPEAQALAELDRRVTQIDLRESREREALRTQIGSVLERVGSTEQFTQSVAETIDEALRRAEVQKHSQLALSIAPLVVTTIKAELKNSQDEMVEALYPITGRLVKAYVASAIKDLTEEMNRKLEMNPVMLRLQSLMTGRSVGELALASTQDFHILELFLIRRGSGELIEHWPQTASGREHLMSGVLAAVNAFANEALSADEGALRQIDLGDETVYLRGSQLYLLAAKCSGTAPKRIEQTLDDAFLGTIEKELYEQAEAESEAHLHGQLLQDLGNELTSRVEAQTSALRKPSGNPLKTLAIIVLLPLLAWVGWSYWVHYANGRTRETAASVIAGTPAMQGYPTHLEASAVGQTLRISGLAPSQGIKADIISRIGQALPTVHINDELAVVPGSDIAIPDTAPEIDKLRHNLADLEAGVTISAMRRSAERATQRVTLAARDISRSANATQGEGKRAFLNTTVSELDALSKDLTGLKARLADPSALAAAHMENLHAGIDAIGTRIAQTNKALAGLIGAAQEGDEALRTSDPAAAAEAMSANAERLSALTSAVLAANAIKIPEPKVVVQPAPVDARTRLATFTARHAIFFTNAAEYRDRAAVERILDELAPLVREADTPMRVVGYTDEVGNLPGNAALALARAEKVRQDLLARQVPVNLLIALGRRNAQDISPAQGPDSPNRRVVFELAYEGEAPQ